MNEEIWTMKDGTKIAVGEMDIEHLRNTLRMIIRTKREKERFIEAIEERNDIESCYSGGWEWWKD